MPHLILEYSANLDDTLAAERMVEAVHEAAIESGLFPRAGARTRAVRQDCYRIADGNPENAFVHLIVRVGRGRSEEELQRAGDHIFTALTEFLDPLYCKRPLAISMEFVEISTWKQNNLRHYLSKDKP